MPFTYEYPHPAVTTDIVLFTVRAGKLQVLLIERGEEPFKGEWALPGGFLQMDEDLDACAARELLEETGVSGVYLEQLGTFGAVGRDPREGDDVSRWESIAKEIEHDFGIRHKDCFDRNMIFISDSVNVGNEILVAIDFEDITMLG